jgi:hypothetical protein
MSVIEDVKNNTGKYSQVSDKKYPEIIGFLLGINSFQGRWFGDEEIGNERYRWRRHLVQFFDRYVKENNAYTMELRDKIIINLSRNMRPSDYPCSWAWASELVECADALMEQRNKERTDEKVL